MKKWVFISVAWLGAGGLYAQCLSAELQSLYENLLEEKDFELIVYQLSLDEYRNPDCAQDPKFSLVLAKSYYHLGRFPQARKTLYFHRNKGDVYRDYYLTSFLLDFKLPDRRDSVLHFVQMKSTLFKENQNARQLYLGALLAIEGESKLALSHLDRARTGAPSHAFLSLSKEAERSVKSPLVGGVAALIPGMGYFYSGDLATGSYSLGLMGVLYGLGAAYGYLGAEKRMALFLSLGGVFHLSSIYGSVKSVLVSRKKRELKLLHLLHEALFE